MSDVNLLAFGCAVSFIALGGAYAYLRECFTARPQSHEPVAKEERGPREAREVA